MSNIKRIGIIGAMKSEMDAIKAVIRDPEKEVISGIEFIKGSLEGVPVVVATCGIGKVFAGMCAQTMVLKYQPELMINVGVAGSLTPELNIGDIAVADCVVQHDMDSRGLGDPIGMISGINIIDIFSDESVVDAMMKSAGDLGYHRVKGRIASGDIFVKDKERKDYINKHFPSIACEMEGGALGQVCYVNKIPFCILRAISDNGDENATGDYGMSLEMAADRATQVLLNYLSARSGS